MPALDSDQARWNGNQPRMSELELDSFLKDCAIGGYSNAELAKKYDKSYSTAANLKTKHRDRIEDLRRKWSVQFEDLHMTRKQSRLDDIQALRDITWNQGRELLGSSSVINGRTGEVRSGLVDTRKLKALVELILKCNRNFAEETGQLPQRVEGLDSRWTSPVLGLSSSSRGIDYAATAQRRREWEAEAPEREAAKRQREAEREAERNRPLRDRLAAIGMGSNVDWDAYEGARKPSEAESFDDELDSDEDDDESDEEAKVQELFRVTPPLPEPVPEQVEDAVEEPELEPEPEPEPAEPEDYQVALERLIAGGVSLG